MAQTQTAPRVTNDYSALRAWETAAAALSGVETLGPLFMDYTLDGEYCRRYRVTITVDGNPRTTLDITDPSVAPATVVAQIRKEAAAWTRANRRARRATASADRW